MKIDRVHFHKSIESKDPLGRGEWDKMGAEASVDEGEDANEAYRKLRETVLSWSNNIASFIEWPANVSNGALIPITTPIKSIDRALIDRLEKLIDDADNENELIKLIPDVVKYGLQSSYEAKLKSLT